MPILRRDLRHHSWVAHDGSERPKRARRDLLAAIALVGVGVVLWVTPPIPPATDGSCDASIYQAFASRQLDEFVAPNEACIDPARQQLGLSVIPIVGAVGFLLVRRGRGNSTTA